MFAYYGSLVGRWRGEFELRIMFDRARDTVTLTQETPFSFGTQILRRELATRTVARR